MIWFAEKTPTWILYIYIYIIIWIATVLPACPLQHHRLVTLRSKLCLRRTVSSCTTETGSTMSLGREFCPTFGHQCSAVSSLGLWRWAPRVACACGWKGWSSDVLRDFLGRECICWFTHDQSPGSSCDSSIWPIWPRFYILVKCTSTISFVESVVSNSAFRVRLGAVVCWWWLRSALSHPFRFATALDEACLLECFGKGCFLFLADQTPNLVLWLNKHDNNR